MLYTGQGNNIVHRLQYGWTGWTTGAPLDSQTVTAVLEQSPSVFTQDHLTVDAVHVQDDMLQVLFSTDAETSPATLAQRAKGRLQHALRAQGHAVVFSRKVAVRSVGHNVRAVVEQYLGRQLAKEDFADPRFVARLQQYTVTVPTVDLSKPAETAHGRYWYNLHLVLVVSGRHRFVEECELACIRDGILAVGEKLACQVAMVSVMPDHVHCALRGDPQRSPNNIGCAFQNGVAEQMRSGRIWEDQFYVGTFSEYDVDAILCKH